MRAGELGGPIPAAAVDHDHLGAALPKRGKVLQRGRDDRRLVERRNDDGERGHASSRELARKRMAYEASVCSFANGQ